MLARELRVRSSQFAVRSLEVRAWGFGVRSSDQLSHLSPYPHNRSKVIDPLGSFSAIWTERALTSRSANASPETLGFALAAAIDQVVVARAGRFFDDVVIVLRRCVQVLQALLIACLQ